MIDVKEAERLDNWIKEAVAGGAKLLCGGKREGAMLEATLLEGVGKSTKLNCEEAFGPVATLSPFSDFDAVLDEVNNSKFGLQAGIFTRDLFKAMKAWDRLEVGGVVIGDVPSYRVDNMPYGGVKDSGLGREGVRFAMEDMTEIRNLVIRTPPGAGVAFRAKTRHHSPNNKRGNRAISGRRPCLTPGWLWPFCWRRLAPRWPRQQRRRNGTRER